MKKIIWTLAAVFCCIATASAQNAEEGRNRTYNIVLDKVEYTHRDDKMSTGEAVSKLVTGILSGQTSVQATKYEADVKTAIIKGLSSSYRYRYNEAMEKSGDGAEEGNLVVDATITNIQAKSSSRTWKDKDDKTQVSTTYTGIVEATLNIKDAKTGNVVGSPTVKGQSSDFSSSSSSDKAIKDAIGRLTGSIASWLNKYKPLRANIIEGSTAKKNKQKEVYIDLGSSEGAFEGLHMTVYQVKTIAGREAKSQIGKLRIEAVEGDDISRCKVQSGGKDIKECIDNGEKLVVMSNE
jgi:hypothetical protein